MNERIERNLRRPVGAFTVSVLLVTAVCQGLDTNEATSGGRGPEPASNQSVSIEDVDSPSVGVPADAGAESVSPSSAPGTRLVRRRSASELTLAPSDGRATAWYRTGLGALTVVLVCVGVLYTVARRWMPSLRAADNGVMRVVGRTTLTPKQSLALIQLGHRVVMVGVSPNRVDTLSEITDSQEAADLLAQAGGGWMNGAPAFDGLLSREVEDFERAGEPVLEPSRRAAVTGVRSAGPLADLLHRLRTLQSK